MLQFVATYVAIAAAVTTALLYECGVRAIAKYREGHETYDGSREKFALEQAVCNQIGSCAICGLAWPILVPIRALQDGVTAAVLWMYPPSFK
jgi:hypothetical protein